MKTYYYCIEDNHGQRTGDYKTIELNENEITKDRHGNKIYKGHYLYDSLYQVLRACDF